MPDDTSASVPATAGSAGPQPNATATTSPGLATIVERAVADLATRLDVDPTVITTVSAAAVTWPDRSIGCPKPGMNYAQVTVDGAQVMLDAAERTYDYHSGSDGQPFLCERTFAATPITSETP